MAGPLTWRNVDAPDMTGVANMQVAAGRNFDAAFERIANTLQGVRDNQINRASNAALLEAAQFTDQNQWDALLKSGGLSRLDPNNLSAEAIAGLSANRGKLLGEGSELLNQDKIRAATNAANASAGASAASAARSRAAQSLEAQEAARKVQLEDASLAAGAQFAPVLSTFMNGSTEDAGRALSQWAIQNRQANNVDQMLERFTGAQAINTNARDQDNEDTTRALANAEAADTLTNTRQNRSYEQQAMDAAFAAASGSLSNEEVKRQITNSDLPPAVKQKALEVALPENLFTVDGVDALMPVSDESSAVDNSIAAFTTQRQADIAGDRDLRIHNRVKERYAEGDPALTLKEVVGLQDDQSDIKTTIDEMAQEFKMNPATVAAVAEESIRRDNRFNPFSAEGVYLDYDKLKQNLTDMSSNPMNADRLETRNQKDVQALANAQNIQAQLQEVRNQIRLARSRPQLHDRLDGLNAKLRELESQALNITNNNPR